MNDKSPRGTDSNNGASLISLLVVLALLGGLATIVVMAQSSTSGPRQSIHIPQLPSAGVAPANAGPDISAATVDACKANYQAASQAVAAYEALNGHPPPNVSAIQAMLKDPLNGVGFQITIDPSGRPEVATAGHPAAAGDSNCSYA